MKIRSFVCFDAIESYASERLYIMIHVYIVSWWQITVKEYLGREMYENEAYLVKWTMNESQMLNRDLVCNFKMTIEHLTYLA